MAITITKAEEYVSSLSISSMPSRHLKKEHITRAPAPARKNSAAGLIFYEANKGTLSAVCR